MFQLKLFLIALTALCSIVGSTSGEKIINCYWGTWSHYRDGDGAFQTKHIDPNLCTHLSYTFQGIDESGAIKVLDPWLDLPDGLNNIAKTHQLKKQNPNLKFILVIGGWNEGSVKYSQMAADRTKRQNFIQSTLKFMKEYKFDGLDLDWEYPGKNGGQSYDKANFVTLLKETHQALKAHNYLFSIAVGASAETAHTSYQLPEICQYLDFINLMTYDFVTSGSGVVGYNAPLRGQGVNNVESSVKFWLSQGVPANKLVLGLPFYGHTFKLANAEQYRLGSQTTGAGLLGPYTKQPGFLNYNEICTMADSYVYEWAEKEHVPILRNEQQLISYDDSESIAQKVNLALSFKLAGVMIWSIEGDDFLGRCGPKNILLKTVNNQMGKHQDMSLSKNKTPVGGKKPATPKRKQPKQQKQPKKPVDPGNCSADGLYPNKSDCTKFIQCAGGVAYDKLCPSGLHFDANEHVCNWPELANCQ